MSSDVTELTTRRHQARDVGTLAAYVQSPIIYERNTTLEWPNTKWLQAAMMVYTASNNAVKCRIKPTVCVMDVRHAFVRMQFGYKMITKAANV